MEQEKIWDYFQNHEAAHDAFPEARQRFMMKFLSRNLVVLNIGVGGGALERMAMDKGVDIHTLDPSERSIERLRNELRMGDKAQAGYAQAMPFESDRFDVVVMSEVLEHLDEEIMPNALHEVLRVLKPGGFLLASTPYDENLEASKVVCPECGKVFHKVGHVQSFDKVHMRRVLSEHGFLVEKLYVTTFVDWQRKGLRNFLKSLIRVSVARLGEKIADPHLIVIARNVPQNG